jgi:undecaprenyl-diphosphatase
MLEKLIHIDTEILLAINGWHEPWADTLMWIISAKATWIPLYIWMIWMLYKHYRQPAKTTVKWLQKVPAYLVMIVVIAITAGAADFIASGILKDLVARPRPTRVPELEGVLHLVNDYRSGQYGFVSSHAATTMACATLFSSIYRNKIATCLLMLWVAMNCYSRMYLGVHYPLDILGGLLVGAIVSWGAHAFLNSMQVLRLVAAEPTSCKSSVANEVPGSDAIS